MSNRCERNLAGTCIDLVNWYRRFQADRAPDHVSKTQNLSAVFVRERGLFMRASNKGRFFHDGRFATLLDVVNHYDIHFDLGLTQQEKPDLVEYLKPL